MVSRRYGILDKSGKPSRCVIIRPDFFQSIGVLTTAARLGITENHAGGLWISWFIYVNNRSVTGFLPHFTMAAVDRIVGAIGFAGAGEEAGWMLFDRMGLQMIDWDKHNAPDSKKRIRDKLTKQYIADRIAWEKRQAIQKIQRQEASKIMERTAEHGQPGTEAKNK